jgi:hypothetical protein
MMRKVAFDVMLNGVRIDTVFRHSRFSAQQIRNQLVAEMCYDSDIVVLRLG